MDLHYLEHLEVLVDLQVPENLVDQYLLLYLVDQLDQLNQLDQYHLVLPCHLVNLHLPELLYHLVHLYRLGHLYHL